MRLLFWAYQFAFFGFVFYKISGEEVNNMSEAAKRAIRTFLQLLAAGGLTAFVGQLSGGLDAEHAALVMGGWQVMVTYTQNLLEDLGWVKPILK